MRFLLCVFFVLIVDVGLNGQPVKSQNIDQNRSLLEERIKSLQEKNVLLKEEIDKNERSTLDKTAELRKETNEKLSNYRQDTKDLVNLYLFFITVIIIGTGALINFFGKNAIKRRIEELITDTAQKHIELKIVETLNSRITNELIEKAIQDKSEEEIVKILESIQHKGNTAIDEIKSKGEELISTLLAAPPKSEIPSPSNPLSDAEIITKNNSLRSDEFFNLAFRTEDQRVKIELYKNVLEIEPNNIAALNNMAVSYNNLNEAEKAIQVLTQAIELAPKYTQAIANRAQSYNLLDNFDDALKDIATVFEIDPKFEYAYTVKGNILTKQGKFDEAEIALNTAVQLNPSSPEAYFNRAFFYEERHEYDKSETDYRKAESLGFENKSMLYNNMAVLFRRLKQFDKAIQFIEKAKSFNPNFPNMDGTIALIYADQDDDENFYTYLKVALEKGCKVWDYLRDPAFSKYRETRRLQMLIEPYKKKYFS